MCRDCRDLAFGASETEEVEETVKCPGCSLMYDPDTLFEVSYVIWSGFSLTTTTVTDHRCEDCVRYCAVCSVAMRSDDATYVWDDYYCEDHYHSCSNEDCDSSVPVGHDYCSDDCRYDSGGCGCESPAQVFSIRNDGNDPLFNDQRTTVTLPKGVITTEGIEEIRRFLLLQAGTRPSDMTDSEWLEYSSTLSNMAYRVLLLEPQWQTKEGNFTKRLGKDAYRQHGFKLPPHIISQVGCIAADHSQAVDVIIDVTRDLNLPPDEFANEDSCWWGGESQSRCALKSNGGFALRTFGRSESNEYADEWADGRAWVMPLKKSENGRLVPTFETLEPDAFVVFNGYEKLSGYAPARVMAHLAGMTYRKVDFRCSPMWINGGSAYIVAPEDIADAYTDSDFYLNLDKHATLYADEATASTITEKEHDYAH